MKYTFETEAPMCSLEDFAAKHGLEMVVFERPLDVAEDLTLKRYYARFRNVDIKRGCMVGGGGGNGNTPEQAIADYAQMIRGCRLVYDAFGNNRREFTAPNEWEAL